MQAGWDDLVMVMIHWENQTEGHFFMYPLCAYMRQNLAQSEEELYYNSLPTAPACLRSEWSNYLTPPHTHIVEETYMAFTYPYNRDYRIRWGRRDETQLGTKAQVTIHIYTKIIMKLWTAGSTYKGRWQKGWGKQVEKILIVVNTELNPKLKQKISWQKAKIQIEMLKWYLLLWALERQRKTAGALQSSTQALSTLSKIE